jgi:hypothetical protein
VIRSMWRNLVAMNSVRTLSMAVASLMVNQWLFSYFSQYFYCNEVKENAEHTDTFYMAEQSYVQI